MIFIDLFIIIMLVITIVFCIKLNRKIEIVQQGKKEFALIFKNFDHTIQKAENSIGTFQQAARQSSYELDEKNKNAKRLIDELVFVVNKANNTLDQLKSTYHLLQNPPPIQPLKTANSNNELRAEKIDPVPINNNKVIVSNVSNPPKMDVLAETKRLAIEDLLHKISEIQKKAGQNN